METMEDISVQKLDDLGNKILEMTDELDAEKKKIVERGKELTQAKEKFLAYLEQFDKKNYPVGKALFSVKEKFSFTTPKGPDAITFFKWCNDEKGEEFVQSTFKMASNSLNSFCNVEIDNALEGGDIDFKIPGIGDKKLFKSLSIRRK